MSDAPTATNERRPRPRVLRVVPVGVRAEIVEAALAWLDEHWQGGVFKPDELLPLV